MTFQAKQFYRKLDGLLHEIDVGTGDQKWFAGLLREIVERFGDELSIESGRLYAEGPGGFHLKREYKSKDPNAKGLVIDEGYRPLQLILEHGVYIFDGTVDGQDAALENRLGGLESVAILIEGRPRRILAFGLRSGWDRDHLDFAVKTIRNAINQRLALVDLESDFDQAAEIQKSLLPETAPAFPGYTIDAQSVAATTVGGDFYDFLPQPPGVMGIAVGDASGHGLGAALLARDVVTGLRMASDRDLKLTSAIVKLNGVISRSMLSTRFVSLFYCELESNGNIFYVNAGHPPPLLFGARGVRQLSIGGTILGPVSDTLFKRGFAHIDRGDTLVAYSDGLVERESASGEEFGEAGIEAVVAPLAGEPAEAILKALVQSSEKHGAGRPWDDDTTVVVVSRERLAPGA
jgi:serine phosphatase RsbU (regulator of sigma subunit)